MSLTSGFLVIYKQNNQSFATLFDEYTNFIKQIKPNSEEVLYHIKDSEAISGLKDEMWDKVLINLTHQERADAIAYRIENEVFTNAELRIEEMMEKNDNEQDYGYNG